MRLKIDRDGWMFLVPAGGAAALFFLLWGPTVPFWIAIVALLALVSFFRDPDRVAPDGEFLVLAAADGIVASIAPAAPPEELGMADTPATRISVFLNLSDVHVTRTPASGRIGAAVYRPGRRMSTAFDKSSDDNERMAVRIDTPAGHAVAACQIAGPFVRRIRCDIKAGDAVVAGDRYGLIRFGSRVDVYVSSAATVRVKVGQRSIGGETVLADLSQLPVGARRGSGSQTR